MDKTSNRSFHPRSFHNIFSVLYFSNTQQGHREYLRQGPCLALGTWSRALLPLTPKSRLTQSPSFQQYVFFQDKTGRLYVLYSKDKSLANSKDTFQHLSVSSQHNPKRWLQQFSSRGLSKIAMLPAEILFPEKLPWLCLCNSSTTGVSTPLEALAPLGQHF